MRVCILEKHFYLGVCPEEQVGVTPGEMFLLFEKRFITLSQRNVPFTNDDVFLTHSLTTQNKRDVPYNKKKHTPFKCIFYVQV